MILFPHSFNLYPRKGNFSPTQHSLPHGSPFHDPFPFRASKTVPHQTHLAFQLLTSSPDARQVPLVLQLRSVILALWFGGTVCCSLSCLFSIRTSPVSHPDARMGLEGCQASNVTWKLLSTWESGTCSPCKQKSVWAQSNGNSAAKPSDSQPSQNQAYSLIKRI